MKVEIWSDIACPWCYVGSARLEKALDHFGHKEQVQVVHRSFELHPDFPAEEVLPVLEMFQRRYGVSQDQAGAQEGRLQQIANAEGLPFSLEREFGNTREAHELAHFAAHNGRGHELMTALYRDYFSAEGTLFTVDGLVDIARKAGLDPGQARAALQDGTYTDAVRADERQARQYGITGVPFFLIDGTYALSGGQSVEMLTSALQQAWDASHPLVRVAPDATTCTDGACDLPDTESRATAAG